MVVTVGVPRESVAGETRVALDPDVVSRLVKKGVAVQVARGAGAGAFHDDAAYENAGATVVADDEAWAAGVVVKVQPPSEAEVAKLRSGAVLIGFLSPLDQPQTAARLADHGVTALSMELVPRISRAQKMDALSAMATVAGYRAVLIGALALPKFFPLLTTAAGTIRPANALILGVGVAGLQAIATAKRLGARVFGYDIREAVREQVQSLGATFVEIEVEIGDMEDTAGYAKALGAEKARQQTKLLVPQISKSDLIVTTALIPGRAAPLLITEEAVAAMQPGAVIVDIAAPNGGNCALTKPGEVVTAHGVTIFGPTNLPAEMPVHASQMYARTVLAILDDFVTEDGFQANFEDEVFAGACVAHAGAVVHERVKGLLAG